MSNLTRLASLHSIMIIALWTANPILGQDLELVEVAAGLDQPVFASHAGDGSGRLFIVEREGRIRILRNGALLADPFLDIRGRVRTNGEFGLLGLAFHPDFESNRRFFIYYSPSAGSARMVVAEYRASAGDPDRAVDSETVVISVDQPFANHNGGTIAFGPDDCLYVGLGDGGSGGDPQGHGQNLDTLLGAMLRLNVDGGPLAPPDNPFVGLPGRDEIWAYGLRNPFRFSFDRQTGRLFLGDVGQNRFEEVDIIERGGNYGWNIMEGDSCFSPSVGCDQTGLTLPIHSYGRSIGTTVTGGVVYRGSAIPGLFGFYVFGDFGSGAIWTLAETSPGLWTRRTLFGGVNGVVAFGEDEQGEIYVVDLAGGRILNIALMEMDPDPDPDPEPEPDPDDADGDGVLDEVERAGPNNGDSNRDGTPDSLQPHVASLQSPSQDPVSLITSSNLRFAQVRFVDNPSPQDAPAVDFPFGFAAFELRGLLPNARATVTMLLSAATPVNSYYRFGPTPADPQPHWYNFGMEGNTGAEIGTHSVTLHFQDGQRGDDDLDDNGTIIDAGGPAIDPGAMRISYFPQVGDGSDARLIFRTSANFVNTGADTSFSLDFFQPDGSPLAMDFIGQGRSASIGGDLLRGQSFTALSSGAGSSQGAVQSGYARIKAGSGVGGTLVFQRDDGEHQISLFESGIPASETLTDFTVLVDSLGARQTGLAMVNPPEILPVVASAATAARVTLRLYDADFNLLAQTTEILQDGQHLARFASEFFQDEMPPGIEEMQGSITVSSDLPLAAVTLRQTDRPEVEFPDEVPFLTAFPVIPGRADQ